MRSIRLFATAALAAAITLFACSDDTEVRPPLENAGTPNAGSDAAAAVETNAGTDPQAIRLSFVPTVGQLPFRCGETYSGVGAPPRDVTPVDFRMYLHDLRLVDADGVEAPLELSTSTWQHDGVAFLDFEDATGSCTDGDALVNREILAVAPAGFRPSGLKFRVGVPQALNHLDLSTQPSPLDRSSLFWAWKAGHIFFAAVGETRIPLDGGVDGPYDHYTHLGSLGCTGDPALGEAVSCAKPNRPEVTLTGFDPAMNEIVVDFAAVKAGSDLAGEGCHGGKAICTTPYAHLGIDWSTGDYRANQDVFRVR